MNQHSYGFSRAKAFFPAWPMAATCMCFISSCTMAATRHIKKFRYGILQLWKEKLERSTWPQTILIEAGAGLVENHVPCDIKSGSLLILLERLFLGIIPLHALLTLRKRSKMQMSRTTVWTFLLSPEPVWTAVTSSRLNLRTGDDIGALTLNFNFPEPYSQVHKNRETAGSLITEDWYKRVAAA